VGGGVAKRKSQSHSLSGRSDDHLATHYSVESAIALLAVRNTQNEDVEDEEEKEEAGEEDISMTIHTHEQALHYISEVM
jgi:hypothetical protein